MAFKALPYSTQATAIWQSSHCHMAVKPLPYGTQVIAIWQSSHCHMALKSLPYGSQATAIWHSSHCRMAVKPLPYGTQVTAIWQPSHCHMAVKTLPPSCGTNLSQPLLQILHNLLLQKSFLSLLLIKNDKQSCSKVEKELQSTLSNIEPNV